MRLWWYRLLSKWYWLEEKICTVIAVAYILVIVLMPILYVACHVSAIMYNDSGDFRRRLIDYINARRETKLVLDGELSASAQQCSEEQLREDRLHHCIETLPNECGEAAAGGSITFAYFWNFPEYVAQGFLDSKPHREILLNPVYRRAGVGVACYTPGYGLPPLPVCYVTVRVCP